MKISWGFEIEVFRVINGGRISVLEFSCDSWRGRSTSQSTHKNRERTMWLFKCKITSHFKKT